MPIQHQFEECRRQLASVASARSRSDMVSFQVLPQSVKFAEVRHFSQTLRNLFCSRYDLGFEAFPMGDRKMYLNVLNLIFWYILDYSGMHLQSTVVWTSLQTLISRFRQGRKNRPQMTTRSQSWKIQEFQHLRHCCPLSHSPMHRESQAHGGPTKNASWDQKDAYNELSPASWAKSQFGPRTMKDPFIF